tara:strand:+ start:594 stop:1634 length:1041 start_codon:yes stop_codon:yes gene_type:complete
VYSAFSIFEAWLRVWAGSQGTCRSEIATALQLKEGEQEVRAKLATLTARITTAGEDCTVATANAIWVRPGLRIARAFETEWGTTRELEFADTAQAAKTINDWIAERTNNMIRDVVEARTIPPLTSIILANAIYLKAKWGTPFDESDTDDETFRLLNHEDVQVPTMWDRGRYACVATDDIEVLRKPYSGGAFELVVVLPRAGRFEEVRGTLTFQSVCDALAATQPIDTILKLPKFSIESTPEIDPFLQSRGAEAIYDPSRADLSALSPDALISGQELFVGQTLHKARIEVDEGGTEAAAVTVLETFGCAPTKTPPPYAFTVDRPFLYFVLETASNLPLFAGQVVDPR